LLAILLLQPNRAIHPDALIEGIWGTRVPQHPDAALQIVVSRLRTALGPVAGRLVSVPGGYRIDVADAELDHLWARDLLRQAQALSSRHDFAGSAAMADAALDCWSGDPLVDLRETTFYEYASHELRELRLAVYESRTVAYLRCGRHVEVLADIDEWVRLEPGRERLRAHQIVALYRAGRRVDALAEFEDLRRYLMTERGVEPSTDMQRLHDRVLAQDPALLARRAGIVATLPAWTPSGLPYVGRHREETFVFERLREVAAGATRMIIVEGEAGIGKSRFVLEAARRAHDEAIVIAVDGADALRPGLHAIATELLQASSRLNDTELALCLGRWPGDLAEIVPALRRRLPNLPPALDADPETRVARLRTAIVSWIAALSQRAPVILLLDDIHRAGPALLVLLGALLVDEEPKRVLVLATARSDAADRSSRLEQLARILEARGVLDRIELKGLTLDSVGRMLAELSIPDASELAPQLTLATRGHPYLLGELLREPDTADAPTVDDVTSRIRQFVLRRVAGLGNPGARLLGIAAAIDGEFGVSILAEVTRGTVASTEVLLDQAIDAGLIHVTGLGRFDFVHDLARRAIVEAVDEDARARVHHDIALALEERGASPAFLASQWSRASGEVARRKALLWADRAGDEALRDLDPHAAALWFGFAAGEADDERTRAHLLIRLAGTQCQIGEEAGATTLRAALEIARRLDDPDLLVEAATIATPIWASMPTLSAGERIAVLADGADRSRDAGTRAQLLARLATELMFTPKWGRARVLAADALAQARAADDNAALAEVLLRHFSVTCSPHNLAERRGNVREVLGISSFGRDPLERFFALHAAAVAAIEAVELEEADVFVDAALEVGRESALPYLSYNVEILRAWRAGLAGDLDEAERLALEARELGVRGGIDKAEVGPALQIGAIRWQQGRLGELAPVLRAGINPHDPGPSILLARALADSEATRGEALELLTSAAWHDFDDLPLGILWGGELVVAGEAAALLGSAGVGRVVFHLLAPFAEQATFNGAWTVGPIAYGAALAAAAAGIPDADALFELALDMCVKLDAPVLAARADAAWRQWRTARGVAPVRRTVPKEEPTPGRF
jgi:DNA-binding SARP family transcriptional activator